MASWRVIFLFIVLQNQFSTASSEANCPGHTGFVKLLFAHLFFRPKYFNLQRDNSVAKTPILYFQTFLPFSSRVSPLGSTSDFRFLFCNRSGPLPVRVCVESSLVSPC